jgi:hypothetical protein
LNSAVGTDVRFDLGPRHFPVFAQGKSLDVTLGLLAIRVGDRVDVSALRLSLDGDQLASFAPRPELGGLLAAELPPAFVTGLRGEHRIAVSDAGGLGPSTGQGALDPAKVLDAVVYVAYRIA